jgi:FkbM family methyltransferase
MWLSRWRYYARSIPTLIRHIRPRLRVLREFLGFAGPSPFTIELSSGCRFRVRSRMDLWIIKETCLERDYERDFIPIRNGWTVLDVGAGLGDFSVCTARQCPDSLVYAFEPLPESFQLLLENVEQNALGNIRPFRLAVTGKTGSVALSTAAGVPEQARTVSVGAGRPDALVDAITLDEAFERFGIGHCDFLKIDCEGAEYEMLFGTSEATLRRVSRIALEYHEGVAGYGPTDLARFLEGRGFRVRTRRNPAHRNIGFLFASRDEPRAAGRRPSDSSAPFPRDGQGT